MATDRHSAAAEAQPSSTHSTEMSSLLAVKQDFSRLTTSLCEKSCSGDSVMSAVSECEESTEADSEVADAASEPLDVDDVTASETKSAEHVEMNSNCEAQDETKDEFHRVNSSDSASYDPESREHEECYNSASSDSEAGLVLQPDKLCDPSSSPRENDTRIASDHLSEAKLKKLSRKREHAECTNSADNRLASPSVKKSRCKTETSPSHLKTSSGTFVVREAAHPGEKL